MCALAVPAFLTESVWFFKKENKLFAYQEYVGLWAIVFALYALLG